jgi:hypothetical protein
MGENEDLFDFSDYPKEHVLYSEKNKRVIGKFKDELNGNIMSKIFHLGVKCMHIKYFIIEKKRRKQRQ